MPTRRRTNNRSRSSSPSHSRLSRWESTTLKPRPTSSRYSQLNSPNLFSSPCSSSRWITEWPLRRPQESQLPRPVSTRSSCILSCTHSQSITTLQARTSCRCYRPSPQALARTSSRPELLSLPSSSSNSNSSSQQSSSSSRTMVVRRHRTTISSL